MMKNKSAVRVGLPKYYYFVLWEHRDKDELKNAVRAVEREQRDALPSCELAAKKRGDSEKRHNAYHKGNVEDEGRIHTEEGRVRGHVEGVNGNSRTRNENEIEDIRADDVTERERAVSLGQCGYSGYKLGERRAECNDSQGNYSFGNVQRVCDSGRTVNEQVCAKRNNER